MDQRIGQAQFEAPSPSDLFTPAVCTILVLFVAGFILTLVAQPFAANWLAMNPQQVFQGMVWQLVTYPFVHMGAFSMVLNGLTVLFVGSAIEREWRTKSFVFLWLAVSAGCGLIWVLVCAVLRQPYVGFGASSCSFGLVGAFGLVFRGKRFLLFLALVEAQLLALILIAIGVLLSLPQPISLIWVLGALVAFVYVKYLWRMGSRRAGATAARSTFSPGRFVDVD